MTDIQSQVPTTTSDQPVEPIEEKELRQSLIPFERYPKLKKWVELFTDKNNKKTYGNRTESAMQAYDCGSRANAAAIGSQNYKKLNGLATIFAEHNDVTIDRLLEVAAARALTHGNPEWFKLFASMMNIYDPKAPSIVVNNNMQQNTQINISEGQEAEIKTKWKKFLEQE